jgi:hypothetical protein
VQRSKVYWLVLCSISHPNPKTPRRKSSTFILCLMPFRSVFPASVAPLWIFTRAPVTVPKQPHVGDCDPSVFRRIPCRLPHRYES